MSLEESEPARARCRKYVVENCYNTFKKWCNDDRSYFFFLYALHIKEYRARSSEPDPYDLKFEAVRA